MNQIIIVLVAKFQQTRKKKKKELSHSRTQAVRLLIN